MIYLFIGEDQFSKEIKLEKIKRQFFLKEFEQFNFDLLYGRELNLIKLQEVLLRLPARAEKRLVLIKQAHLLNNSIKKYLLSFIKRPHKGILVILDLDRLDKRDLFIKEIMKFSTAFHFRERQPLNTFKLSRAIDNKKIIVSLKILKQLLLEEQRPEKIIGGLRFCWENSFLDQEEKKRRLILLLNCDIDIKTGRLKPQLALERLLISLCYSKEHPV